MCLIEELIKKILKNQGLLKEARIKSEVVRDYMQQVGVLQNKHTKLSDANFELIKEEETKQAV